MFIVLNLIIIGLVLLIAYWWANQGLFSGLLHLLCVILAGTVALAFWEPVTVGLLLRGGPFDNYAWGVTLVSLFVLTLLVFRIISDKTVRANVDMPTWANLVFGFPVGLVAGVLTMGIYVIGAGFIQSNHEILGYHGSGRHARTAEVVDYSRQLWLPVHKLTAAFYEAVSVGSLSTGSPLAHYNPNLAQQSALVRDSFGGGKGQLSLLPSEVEVSTVYYCNEESRYLISVRFDAGARDFGEQLTLSRSQIRLITSASGSQRPSVVPPDRWTQDSGHYTFDDITHYVTSGAGREFAEVLIEFNTAERARFLQIRNTRLDLPSNVEPISADEISSLRGGGSVAQVQPPTPRPPSGGSSLQEVISISNGIRPVVISSNMMPSGIEEKDKLLTEGFGTFRKAGGRPARNLLIKGIYEPPGTRIVQLDVSRDSPADIFDASLRDQVPPDARLALVDQDGNTFSPIGYIHRKIDGTDIKLEPTRFLRTANDLPVLPNNPSQRLRLLFNVTEGATIIGFRYGDVSVGSCELFVAPKS